MGILGSEKAYELLTDKEKDFIYNNRLRPIKIMNPTDGTKGLSESALKKLNDRLNQLLKIGLIYPGNGEKAMNLYEFVVYAETIHMHWRNLKEENFKHTIEFKALLTAFDEDYQKLRGDAYIQIENHLDLVAIMHCDSLHRILWMEKEIEQVQKHKLDPIRCFNNYIVHVEKPETAIVEINGEKRCVYRVGMSVTGKGIKWIRVIPERMGISGILQKMPLDVYIQAHAVERLEERLGNTINEFCAMNIAFSILENDIQISDDGSILIAYKTDLETLGYLKAVITGDKLVIRTFLFLTNNGTPEGKKLAELIGVTKADKKYLGIDKLELFLTSDIEDNEPLKKIFCQAGCGQLFTLKEQLEYDPDFTFKSTAFVSKYLGLEDVPEQMKSLRE